MSDHLTAKPIRTRIAPSPTGYMHIGTLRTALYDYFLARQSGGQFIVRIEDTDQERLVPGALESLLGTLRKLGLEHDEGPVLLSDGSLGEQGSFGPYIQSQRLDLYRQYAKQLLEAGHAYHCFCTAERLDEMRKEQISLKQAPRYDRRCLGLSREEIQTRLARQEPHVLRMKIPAGESRFTDAIRGEIVFQNSEVDDQVLIKSDGFPTYHLAVVVDDHLMEITHVLRGEEWISSTPKQIILHQMLGWEMPAYAHVPLILNPDKTKLSKRKGDVSVGSYLQKGYLPKTLINFLALLGWNPTEDREIFELDELVQMFDLAKVNKAGAVMNLDKLDWLNSHYIKELSEREYLLACRPWLTPFDQAQDFIDRACLMARERLKKFSELPELVAFLFKPTLKHDPASLSWKMQAKEETRERLEALRKFLADRPAEKFSSVEQLDQDIRVLIQARGWGNGDTLWPLRVALSGSRQSPSPFELVWTYGRERSLARIDEALARLA